MWEFTIESQLEQPGCRVHLYEHDLGVFLCLCPTCYVNFPWMETVFGDHDKIGERIGETVAPKELADDVAIDLVDTMVLILEEKYDGRYPRLCALLKQKTQLSEEEVRAEMLVDAIMGMEVKRDDEEY